ncbi:chemotaxis protein CheW [Moritella sp. 24]|uniref:chemotaxis protein CheW n=1 Tax=Moritella sp. 24 TaxID=2746230 RepID=UPI001BA68BE4|nr:chemotaxis protein CheW [Moritella sp. 24]QUM77476.1 chemotaxis protein CheW [Moritella sp. 24]
MDKYKRHSALDDYFSSMLSEPVAEEPLQVEKEIVEQPMAFVPDLESSLKLQLVEPAPILQSDYKIPEPDGSGSLTDLDQLLGSVIDIDLADIDLSLLDNEKPAVEMALDEAIEVVATDIVTDAIHHELEVTTQDITIVEDEVIVASVSESIAIPDIETTSTPTAESVAEPELEESIDAEPEWKNIELEEHFQALFFEVAGVIFAVPLTELGGIHQIETVNSLFGKPDWYLGIMQHREQKLSVVDTAQWVMPEQNMGEIDYKYQIQLSESNWVLGCESLHGTETLSSNDIKWRSTPGSRPWLAGMVKSRMCVLLHVTEMIKLLDNGINIHGQ